MSSIVGHIETDSQEYVFVSRVRAQAELSGLAGADLALRVLNDDDWRRSSSDLQP